MPIPAQAAFVFARIAQMAPDHPSGRQRNRTGGPEAGRRDAPKPERGGHREARLHTHAGMTVEEFEAEAKRSSTPPSIPVSACPTRTVYQPMLELLALLASQRLQDLHRVRRGGEFMRTFSEEVYGIPRENVVGSSLEYEFQQTSDGSGLVRHRSWSPSTTGR